jgi:type IV pilus assembly protein PilX
MNKPFPKYTLKNQQSGVVLVISLIMLLLLTMLSTTSMQVTSMEEKMANNAIDKNRAFQAAETALRYAEQDINSVRINGTNGFLADCTDGLCFNGGTPYINIEDNAALVANAVEIQTHNASAPNITGVAEQPRYLIVGMPDIPSVGDTTYQITAFGTGAVATTQSVLRGLFTVPTGP